jgi:tetratricopeptide (TPR) repeat protein
MVSLLPTLVEPGRKIDPSALSALTDRRPAAVAAWLQGEREYRRSQFARALAYFRRAVETDSALGLAALRGAQAASWLDRAGEADQLLNVALGPAASLAPKDTHFARGLKAFFAGAADSAVEQFSRAIEIDSAWSAAWMALGEVHYHLFPGGFVADSSAERDFEAARRADPNFAPPLFHLLEIVLRRGDVSAAEGLVRAFRRFGADSALTISMTLMLDCARGDPESFDWSHFASHWVSEVMSTSRWLSVAGAHAACAEGGYRAVLRSDSATPATRWPATLGLQSLLLARGQRDQAKAVLDSAVATGIMEAMGLYVVDAVAGAGMESEAAKVIQSLAGNYQDMSTQRLWYHGIWAFHQAAIERLDTIVRAMMKNAEARPDPDSLLTEALAARLALLRGDTIVAVARLAGLRPSAPHVDLTWGLWESLGSERLLLADLLMAQGEYAEALRVADGFDQPQPAIYLMYLPASLTLRTRAAERLARPELAEVFRQRLRGLGRGDLLQSLP